MKKDRWKKDEKQSTKGRKEKERDHKTKKKGNRPTDRAFLNSFDVWGLSEPLDMPY